MPKTSEIIIWDAQELYFETGVKKMSINNENQEGHYDDTKVVGKGTDGAIQTTVVLVFGAILIIAGFVLSVYMNTLGYGFAIGIPLIIIGFVIPFAFLIFIARNKAEKPETE
jgi:hypothetical protein